MGRCSAWLLVGLLASSMAPKEPSVQDGDIVFHTSRSSQSAAIQRATGSRYSHMGLVLYRSGQPCVLEAVATVRCTPLGAWIKRGVGGHFVVKRLKSARSALTAAGVEKLRQAAGQLEGRPHDSAFSWSDERIYCSELVWKAYERALGIRVGELQELREFNLSAPEVRTKLRERYGKEVPLREPVIAPGAMFTSPLLETIASQ
jgi:hypothetical protein